MHSATLYTRWREPPSKITGLESFGGFSQRAQPSSLRNNVRSNPLNHDALGLRVNVHLRKLWRMLNHGIGELLRPSTKCSKPNLGPLCSFRFALRQNRLQPCCALFTHYQFNPQPIADCQKPIRANAADTALQPREAVLGNADQASGVINGQVLRFANGAHKLPQLL